MQSQLHLMSGRSKFSRYLWLIPLAMLILAALACDDVIIPSVMVDRVEADATVDGKIYVNVINANYNYSDNPEGEGQTITYESTDHGKTWQRSEHRFADPPAKSGYTTEWYGEQLILNGYGVWSFPRSMFRGVFYDGFSYNGQLPFNLPQGLVNNAVQGNTIYVAAGTQGVLVAHFDDRNGLAPDWQISSHGMDALTPLPLTITDPYVVLFIVVMILVVPPFALIHAYWLRRVWLYVLPPTEAGELAYKVTGGLVIVAIIGAVFWLTNDRIDLYQVLAVCTLIAVVFAVTVTVRVAQKAGVTAFTRNALVVAAILTSLITPGAVAAIFALWWLAFGLVFAFWAYQRAYAQFVSDMPPTPQGRVQRWRIDRVSLEMVIIILIGLVILFFVTAFLENTFFIMYKSYGIILLFGVALGIFGFYLLIRYYALQRVPALAVTFRENRELSRLSRALWWHTIFWLVLAVVATIATLFAQGWAYTWFTSLLKTTNLS